MNRRRFLGLVGAAAGALAGPIGRGLARTGARVKPASAATAVASTVLELIHLPGTPFTPDPPALADLLDLALPEALGRTGDLPLDLWSDLFPETAPSGVL